MLSGNERLVSDNKALVLYNEYVTIYTYRDAKKHYDADQHLFDTFLMMLFPRILSVNTVIRYAGLAFNEHFSNCSDAMTSTS